MLRKFSFCLAALVATSSPVLAQTVTISQSPIQVQPLSPSLGGTDTLAIVSPELADALIQVPTVATLPPSGEVSSTLGETETLAVVTPAQAEALIEVPVVAAPPVPQPSGESFVLSQPEPSLIDTLPRIEPSLVEAIVIDELTVSPDAPPAEEDVSLYVVGDGTILPASEWGAADSAACKASGGIELPLPAGRIACFKL